MCRLLINLCWNDENLIKLFVFAVSIETDEFEIIPLTAEKVLEIIEQAYPNPVAIDDLAR